MNHEACKAKYLLSPLQRSIPFIVKWKMKGRLHSVNTAFLHMRECQQAQALFLGSLDTPWDDSKSFISVNHWKLYCKVEDAYCLIILYIFQGSKEFVYMEKYCSIIDKLRLVKLLGHPSMVFSLYFTFLASACHLFPRVCPSLQTMLPHCSPEWHLIYKVTCALSYRENLFS